MAAHQRTFVVVVESDGGRKSRTVGPYHNEKQANGDAERWSTKGRKAWVEPVHHRDEFIADPELPVAIHS